MIGRIQYNAPVVLTFSLLATLVYFANNAMLGSLSEYFVLQPDFNFSDPASYVSLAAYVLGHSSTEHLIGNLSIILLVGPIVEEKYGSANTLIMIVFTAIATGIGNMLLFSTGIIGASGIAFMFIILVSFANSQRGRIPLTFILVAALYLGKEVVVSFQNDNISQFAHILGGILGAIFGFYTERVMPVQRQKIR
ncbi:MAG TPA: rhomboid family intramembrane serine protease [Bacteroidales bacterium]|nr:rhomboid family intramembrane serine protease [Bacteroidales bacterium]